MSKYFSIFAMLICSIATAHGNGTMVNVELPRYRCETVTMGYCSNMDYYNTTIMPNLLGHEDQKSAMMEVYRFHPLVLAKCNNDLQLLLCSLYIPACTDLGRPVAPCRSLCLSVRRDCAFDWPEEFNCERFPDDQEDEAVSCVQSSTFVEKSDFEGIVVFSNGDKIDSLNSFNVLSKSSPIPLLMSRVYLKYAAGLAYDYTSKRIIYGDYKKGIINTVSIDGSDHYTLASKQGEVLRIEFDRVRRILYWVYKYPLSRQSINYMKLSENGGGLSNVRVLLHAPFGAGITGIAIDDCAQQIFWAQCKLGHTAIFKTQTINLLTEAIISSEIHIPRALTLDQQAKKLYWSDLWYYRIEKCDYDGANRVILVQGKHAWKVYGMAIYGNYLFWTEWWSGSLYKSDKMTGRNVVVLHDHIKAPIDVIVIGNDTNECGIGKEDFLK